jgi:hypothetical protein
VDRAALAVWPHDPETIGLGQDHEAAAETARAVGRVNDRQAGVAAGLDRVRDLVVISVLHATHHSPTSWVWPTTPPENSSVSAARTLLGPFGPEAARDVGRSAGTASLEFADKIGEPRRPRVRPADDHERTSQGIPVP